MERRAAYRAGPEDTSAVPPEVSGDFRREEPAAESVERLEARVLTLEQELAAVYERIERMDSESLRFRRVLHNAFASLAGYSDQARERARAAKFLPSRARPGSG